MAGCAMAPPGTSKACASGGEQHLGVAAPLLFSESDISLCTELESLSF